MEGGGFGRNAGPRGDYRGPVPVFGSSAPANPADTSKPLLRPDPNLGFGSSAYPTPQRPVANFPSVVGAKNVWKRIRPAHETQTQTQTPSQTSAPTARSHELSGTEMNYQNASKKSRSRSPQSDFMPRTPPSPVNINNGRKQVAYDDFILDDASVEPPRGNQLSNVNQFRPPMVQPRLGNQNSKGNQFQSPMPRKQVAYDDFILDDASIEPPIGNQLSNVNQFRPPMVQSRLGNQNSKGNQFQSPMPRKQVAYDDFILDDASIEPPIGNQLSNVNQFQPPTVQPRLGNQQSKGNQFHSPMPSSRRSVLPQTSHKKEVATQKRGKLSDHKSLPSPLHGVENSMASSSDIHAEREEEEAKARRLARFGAELSQPAVEMVEPPVSNVESSKQQAEVDFSEATAIVGLCPDMCPEPERGERQRKGDLDKHERLDGDRNVTTKFLAVKKYTRTAERDPDLIRPLPVLMKSMDYLLGLLNKPYGDELLGLYNFLWDRMRAIRMDLRMQHIFNQEAISMLEQMIRLHIIAMHELCEYNKGEGFSEGFDAHLNIEQMNKASVELFQMYEDHKRKGISICTEREFRGYYALLKLDKHPGYKVEPAELSLDLAKMSAEVRHSPEIAFARDVAKACRSGNYISFFRLAKKATYLQACLMHAHFSKLRTEALASLHSSFQSNQGMPLAHLENILAMEGEDIVSFVENHGFVLRSFEETYIVKSGPFLRQEGEPRKRSPLVARKRSLKINLDLCSSPGLNTASIEDVSCSLKVVGPKRVSPEKSDTEVSDPAKLVKVSDQAPLEFQPGKRFQEKDVPVIAERPIDVPVIAERPIDVPVITERPIDVPVIPLCHLPTPPFSTDFLPVIPASNAPGLTSELISSVNVSASKLEDEMETYPVVKSHENMKVFRDKMKPIFRKWRQRAKEIRLLREKKERKEALVREALASLSVGPYLRTSVYTAPRKEMLNIDRAIRARLRKQEKSWTMLNTSELVTPILAEQNPNARCLCWKLLLSLPADPIDTLPIKWLLTKFNLHEKSSLVSISETWSYPQLSLSFVRADKTGPFVKKSAAGASSILFLLSGDTPLEVHKARLHNLCSHIHAHSYLPLLIAIGDHLNGEEETAIIDKLGLADIEQTKLKGISVIYLNQNPQNEFGSNGFLDDGRLREGVRWLAEHSPPQSEVSLVDTRTILLSYLKLKLEVLGDACEVGPDQCIAAINESIDWLIRAILGSASANPNFWPCPETDLLEKSSSERNYAEMTLPTASWSEPEKVQAQTNVLNGCKLPCFGFDCSWLSQGSYYTDKKHIQDLKRGLEEYLFKYLNLYTESNEAMEEARNLVQRCTSLVLRDSCFYLVPRWTAIFRRIFNLRLITIPKDASDVYVSEDIANVEFFNVGWKDLLVSEELPLVPLDEMIERSFIVPQTVVPAYTDVPADTVVPTIPVLCDVHADFAIPTYKADEISGNDGLLEKDKKPILFVQDDRLQMLFDKCTKVQDEIDKKLFIYF